MNRLTELTNDAAGSVPTIYAYDRNGNLTSTTQNNQVTASYEYDGRDQLRRVLNGSSQELASYDYDFERRRISKTVGASSLKYVYGGDQVINEYNESNQLQNRYDLGGGEVVRAELFYVGARVGRAKASALAERATALESERAPLQTSPAGETAPTKAPATRFGEDAGVGGANQATGRAPQDVADYVRAKSVIGDPGGQYVFPRSAIESLQLGSRRPTRTRRAKTWLRAGTLCQRRGLSSY